MYQIVRSIAVHVLVTSVCARAQWFATYAPANLIAPLQAAAPRRTTTPWALSKLALHDVMLFEHEGRVYALRVDAVRREGLQGRFVAHLLEQTSDGRTRIHVLPDSDDATVQQQHGVHLLTLHGRDFTLDCDAVDSTSQQSLLLSSASFLGFAVDGVPTSLPLRLA